MKGAEAKAKRVTPDKVLKARKDRLKVLRERMARLKAMPYYVNTDDALNACKLALIEAQRRAQP